MKNKIIYHFYAKYFRDNIEHSIDGILTMDSVIVSFEEYSKAKGYIIKKFNPDINPSELAIVSLSRIN